MRSILWALSLLLLAACNKAGANDNPVLNIEGGQVQGVKAETPGVTIYKGIPYAAPPVGENRWREPQPVIPWQGVKAADEFGNAAMQPTHQEGEFYYKEFFFDGDAPYSEDCLTLNVWTPAPGKTNAKLPVAMWVHGGGYVAGWGFEKEMDGEAWAERDVVLVTINYRLGIFGFLAHPELARESAHNVAGNYGTLDQIAALRWVRNNIEQFGGDPDNIMIFGQSAGAASIKTLVASPLTKGMISRAIIMSGGGLDLAGGGGIGEGAYENALASGKQLMDFGGYTTLEKMRAASTEDIYQLNSRYAAENGRGAMPSPVIDGYVSIENFSQATLNGNIADVPYMIGFVSGDMRMGPLGAAEPLANFCLAREEAGKEAYAYQFARPLPGDDAGAYHSSELWYIFQTLSRSWRPFTPGDYNLSDKMVDAWTNFSKYGNPNGRGRGPWAPYTKDNGQFMIFDVDANDNASAQMGPIVVPAR